MESRVVATADLNHDRRGMSACGRQESESSQLRAFGKKMEMKLWQVSLKCPGQTC